VSLPIVDGLRHELQLRARPDDSGAMVLAWYVLDEDGSAK
jgi:hypothetical protein